MLAALRGEIRKLEGFKAALTTAYLNFDIPEIDNCFPNQSMPLGTTHEFVSQQPEDTAATLSFISAILSKINHAKATVVWISKSTNLYPPGLIPFGVNPDRLVFIRANRAKECLWAIEEALRTKGLVAVVGEIGNADLTATRRLQLAVEKSGTTGFLLRNDPTQTEHTSVCVTRWLIKQLPSVEMDNLPGVGKPRWKVELSKVRHGQPGVWNVEWCTNQFKLISEPIKNHHNSKIEPGFNSVVQWRAG